MSHTLQLLLLLAVVVTAAKLAGAAANRIGQPAVFGEILIGLLLGPTLLDIMNWPIFHAAPAIAGHGVEPGSLAATIRDLAEIGVILLMFIAGAETDVDEMRVGRVAFWAAFGGVALPMIGGALVAAAFGYPPLARHLHRHDPDGDQRQHFRADLDRTWSPEIQRGLDDSRRRRHRRRHGHRGVVDRGGIGTHGGAADIGEIAFLVLRIGLFFGERFSWVGPAADRTLRGAARGQPGSPRVVLAIAFVYAWAAEHSAALLQSPALIWLASSLGKRATRSRLTRQSTH